MALGPHRFAVSMLAIGTCFVFAPGRAAAQGPTQVTAEQLTLPQVVAKLVEKNEERAKALESYKDKRVYTLNYVGLPSQLHADMTVDMSYNAPATKEFHVVSENGSHWIVNHVLKRLIDTEQEALEEANRSGVELNPDNYIFTALEYDRGETGCRYVLSVQPKIATKFLYRGRIWVDDKDFAVCRVEAEPAKNPSFWIKKTQIRHSYQKVGDFWLPAENESISNLRFDGRATLTIKYKEYEIQRAPAHTADNITQGH
jgi:hypothetical protein